MAKKKANGSANHKYGNGKAPEIANGAASPPLRRKNEVTTASVDAGGSSTSMLYYGIYALGIWTSFIAWGVLQERITTTNYGTESKRKVFKYPVVMNTVQSTFAAMIGYLYIQMTRKTSTDMPVFPSWSIFQSLSLVAVLSSLSSPFGYASLQHVDYITFILAKSCKLLPVMFIHITLYRKRYPLHQYAVVALVTSGVAIFTLHQSSGSKKKGAEASSIYGLVLLSINLLFDGLTNATQDDIYARFRPYSGQQMMCALNVMSTVLTTVYLMVSPYLVHSGLGAYVGMDPKSAGELQDALAFIQRHPSVGWDILGFAACGAMGQVFIFLMLSTFGSLQLVTVTVTRKMLTMIFSVVMFGHRLSRYQWLGVGLVFGGVIMEAQLNKREKLAKERAKLAEKKA